MTTDENRPFPTPDTPPNAATGPEDAQTGSTQPGEARHNAKPGAQADTQPNGAPPRPPYGMPPPPGAPRATPPPPEKVRRVGTLTMGFSLIAAGVFALVYLMFPQFDLVFVLRLSPIILILLGLEIIINAIIFRGQKLKYDLLSGFVCLILIMGSLFASVLPKVYTEWGPHRNEMEQSMQNSANSFLAEQLGSVTLIQSLNTDIYMQRSELSYKQNATYGDILPSDYFSANVLLKGDYKDRESFAAACRTVLDRMQAVPLEFDNVTLRYYGSSEELISYKLSVDNPFIWKQDAASLTALVDNTESERQQLSNERQSLYDELQSERDDMHQQLESEREGLASERQSLYDELQSERESDNQQLASEREALSSERQSLYEELQSEREEMTQ